LGSVMKLFTEASFQDDNEMVIANMPNYVG